MAMPVSQHHMRAYVILSPAIINLTIVTGEIVTNATSEDMCINFVARLLLLSSKRMFCSIVNGKYNCVNVKMKS